jgi:23S rRNA (cytosine1962-C5)-methyltransferase
MTPRVMISPKGAGRIAAGHPWVYRSDIREDASIPAGLVSVTDHRGKPLGTALYSPHSEIRVRWLAPDGVTVDDGWWRATIAAAVGRRRDIGDSGHRLVHGEADGLPSLVVDRYGDVVVAQLLSAGIETVRAHVVDAILAATQPRGLLLRNDAPVREREKLSRETVLASGDVPQRARYTEGTLALEAAPWTGQKTGAFLDQRENHLRARAAARGRCADVFSYHGGFALQLAAGGAGEVIAVDSSAGALDVLRETARANGVEHRVRPQEADAFDWLRAEVASGRRYEVIALDPPAFAKERRSVERALAAYRELNIQALKLLAGGGRLLTFSCSYHVHRGEFFAMLAEASQDSGRRIQLVDMLGAAADHPELLTIPETGYLKGAELRAAD